MERQREAVADTLVEGLIGQRPFADRSFGLRGGAFRVRRICARLARSERKRRTDCRRRPRELSPACRQLDPGQARRGLVRRAVGAAEDIKRTAKARQARGIVRVNAGHGRNRPRGAYGDTSRRLLNGRQVRTGRQKRERAPRTARPWLPHCGGGRSGDRNGAVGLNGASAHADAERVEGKVDGVAEEDLIACAEAGLGRSSEEGVSDVVNSVKRGIPRGGRCGGWLGQSRFVEVGGNRRRLGHRAGLDHRSPARQGAKHRLRETLGGRIAERLVEVHIGGDGEPLQALERRLRVIMNAPALARRQRVEFLIEEAARTVDHGGRTGGTRPLNDRNGTRRPHPNHSAGDLVDAGLREADTGKIARA